MRIRDYLKHNKLIADGAMGTYYSGLTGEDSAVSELANLNRPDMISAIHKSYIAAGAGLIRTNSFAANRQVLAVGKEEQAELLTASYLLARQAVLDSGREVYIACDIGPISEHGGRTEEDILEEYRFICDTFLKQKPEIFLFETFADLRFINRLVPYIREKAPQAFIITTFCLNKNGYTSSGISAASLLRQIAETDGIDAGGFNCGIGSGHMYQILKNLNFPADRFILAAPNAGYPERLQNRMVFMDNEGYFGTNMKQIEELGVDMIGGCCGTTPKFIRKLSELVDGKRPGPNINYGNRTDYRKEAAEQKELRKNEFYELFRSGKKVVAVELDPPYDARDEKLIACAQSLKRSGADIITIADSPMGRSRVDSILMSVKLSGETGMPVMPHVCCRDKNVIAMRSGLLGAYANGIRNILIVTGDPIPSESRRSATGVFDYNSIQLMQFVQEMNREHFSEEPFYYGGALNYGRGNIETVIERMQKKIAVGTKYFLTQPVFCDEDIERLRTIKSRVDTKLLCGIMPLTSYRNANFIRNEITGIHVPDSVVARYHPDMPKEEAECVGAEIAGEIIERLSPFADGYYFMLPFNRVSFMEKIKIR